MKEDAELAEEVKAFFVKSDVERCGTLSLLSFPSHLSIPHIFFPLPFSSPSLSFSPSFRILVTLLPLSPLFLDSSSHSIRRLPSPGVLTSLCHPFFGKLGPDMLWKEALEKYRAVEEQTPLAFCIDFVKAQYLPAKDLSNIPLLHLS